MESVGKYLKAQRELRNLSLEEAAKSTKIRKQLLKAIEEDKYDLLPPAVYVKGFLTVYAKYLGLDPYDVVSRYKSFLKSLTISKQVESQEQTSPLKNRVRLWLFFFLLFVIILFVGFFVYYTFHEHSEWIPPTREKSENQIPHEAAKENSSKLKEAKTKDAVTIESPLEVLEASMGTGVERKDGGLVLIGECSEFTCNNQRVYFLTRIKAQREGKVAHVWLFMGKEINTIEIEVKPPTWSVYSHITLRPQHAGNWKAEVRDGNILLKSLDFKATESDYYSIQERQQLGRD